MSASEAVTEERDEVKAFHVQFCNGNFQLRKGIVCRRKYQASILNPYGLEAAMDISNFNDARYCCSSGGDSLSGGVGFPE